MKKVGIVTLFGGANYGNVLQNYAVEQLLSEAGYQPETLRNQTKRGFIDNSWRKVPMKQKLTPSYMVAYLRTRLNQSYGCKNDRDFRLWGLIPSRRKKDAYKAAQTRRREKFNAFRAEYLHLSDGAITAQHFDRAEVEKYTAFVTGSDQVWNPYYNQISSVDLLQFAPRHKRIALAPSFGVSQIPDARKEDFSKWLGDIPHLSVREDAGAKIIRELTGAEAPVILDPTLCITAQRWASLMKEPQHKPQGEFVLCYFLGNKSKRYCKYIEKYAKSKGCQVVDVCDVNDYRYYDCDPGEFLWLLSHARAVFTDSFHGTAFSINLQVPFVVFDRVEGGSSMSSRISTLLEKTGLSSRHHGKLGIGDIDNLDFAHAQAVLASEREKEIRFLKDALADAEASSSVYLASKYHCSGCGACYNACLVEAISMRADSEGFCYPKIDPQKCIGCHACEKACPADSIAAGSGQPSTYAAYSRDIAVQGVSSSGGVFTHLASFILAQGGVVFGAAYDEDFRVCHVAAETQEALSKLRTSKYVQSDTGLAFRQAKAYLNEGRKVLFTGTPCQIAALCQYLKKDYDNLYTQDIICHGVPSPEAFQVYLTSVHAGKDIQAVSFRDKTQGWNDFSMKVEYADGTHYRQLATVDPFVKAFLANLNLRPSCYQCQYKTASRVSDLTLADYWGVEVVHPELKDQQGVSLVLTHSQKGEALLKAIQSEICSMPTPAEKAIGMNHAALHSVACPAKRSAYFAQFRQEPMKKLVDGLLKKTFSQKLRRFVFVNGSRVKKLLRKLTKR